jgi:non-ribosomal peptide synthetase component F
LEPTGRDPAIVSTIATTFAQRAAPAGCVAVVAEGRSVSFAELDAMSRARLRASASTASKRGDLVGAYCRRSPELIAVVLGIWRCGGVYVPLDPKYPSQRLKAILADAALPLCVCDSPLPSRLTTTEMVECDAVGLCSTPLEHAASEEATVEAALPQLADRAVVLYTSGSTGTPKGAILTHRNLANHNTYVIRAFDLGPNDRRTAVCSINFDASLEEFFCTLNAGATLVLPETDTLIR